MANILMVEDNDDVAAIYKSVLEAEGYQVDRVASAYPAIQKSIRVDYDLVIMDLLLAGANGAVVALALRGLAANRGLPPPPVLVVTGGLMPLAQEVVDEAKFAGYLLKGATLPELVAEVKRHIAHANDPLIRG